MADLMGSSMVDTTEVVPLFPTFVWKIQLKADDSRRINEGIRNKLESLTTGMPDLGPGGKWQTEQTLHKTAEFQELNAVVTAAARGVLDFLKVLYTSIEVTGCWANVSAPGARHKAHTHPNNYLSAVYYVKTVEGADSITFDDPRPQANIICPMTSEPTQENAGQMHVGVQEGMLVLFPSWLPHSVELNRSNQLRISVAYNLMFTSFGESMSQPKWEGNVEVGA